VCWCSLFFFLPPNEKPPARTRSRFPSPFLLSNHTEGCGDRRRARAFPFFLSVEGAVERAALEEFPSRSHIFLSSGASRCCSLPFFPFFSLSSHAQAPPVSPSQLSSLFFPISRKNVGETYNSVICSPFPPLLSLFFFFFFFLFFFS